MAALPFFQKSQKILAVEIGDRYYKVACFSKNKNGSVELLDAGMDARESFPEEDIAAEIKRFSDKNRLKEARVLNIIPSQYAIFKNIEIPSIDEKEIKQIIDLQSGTHTPYPKEEVVLDYLRVSTFQGRYTKELLVITKREVVTRRYDILKKAGLRADDSYLSAEGVALQVALRKIKTEKPIGLIHVDMYSTDFIIVQDRKPAYIRSIGVGASDIQKNRMENCPLFVEEIKKSMESYQANGISEDPSEIIFTGVVDPVRGLLDEVCEVLNVKYEMASYSDLLDVGKKVKKSIEAKKEMSVLTVTSAVMTGRPQKISLIPEDIRCRQELEMKSKEITRIGVFSFVAFILLCAIFLTDIFFKHMFLTQLRESYREENREVQRLDKISTKTNRMERFLEEKGKLLSVLVELYDVIPGALYLDNIEYADDGTLTVTGTAPSMSRIFAMVTEIEKGRTFKNVNVDFTRTRRFRGEEVADFGLTMETR